MPSQDQSIFEQNEHDSKNGARFEAFRNKDGKPCI